MPLFDCMLPSPSERNQDLVCFCWLNCWMMRLMFALQANEKKHVATADE